VFAPSLLPLLIAAAAAAAAVVGLAYWLFVITEGAYLGRRIVIALYDRFAPRYDHVKDYDPRADAFHLSGPIVAHDRRARVLDVATGTGRLPAALSALRTFTGVVHGVDASTEMLRRAAPKFTDDVRVHLHRADAMHLPFADESFSCVTCLEALEFFPRRVAALRELMRVLQPGGLLVVSNRVGPDAWKFPGRAVSSADFVSELHSLGAVDGNCRDWLVDYDLIIAKKAR
jgi:SAM-dependent methyltransferase